MVIVEDPDEIKVIFIVFLSFCCILDVLIEAKLIGWCSGISFGANYDKDCLGIFVFKEYSEEYFLKINWFPIVSFFSLSNFSYENA